MVSWMIIKEIMRNMIELDILRSIHKKTNGATKNISQLKIVTIQQYREYSCGC